MHDYNRREAQSVPSPKITFAIFTSTEVVDMLSQP